MRRRFIVNVAGGLAIGLLLIGGAFFRRMSSARWSDSTAGEWDDLNSKYNSGPVPNRALEGAVDHEPEDNAATSIETEDASTEHSDIPASNVSSPNSHMPSKPFKVTTLLQGLQSVKAPATGDTLSPLVGQLPPPQPVPVMGDYNCSEQLCTEFLTKEELKRAYCQLPKRALGVDRFPGKCHFMNGTNRSPVYLVSNPGSGNTWVRGLLEKATGICTGAVYCDRHLKQGGFNGEGLTSGVVLTVKSHYRLWPPEVKSAIVIVRNPLDSCIAEWNRRRGNGHTGLADKTHFGSNRSWNEFVRWNRWPQYFKWVVTGLQTGRQVLVVRYEDLKSDLMTQMKRMLEFLGVPYSDEALQRRMSNNYDKFYRPQSKNPDFEHYTPKQRGHLKKHVEQTIQYLKTNNHGETYGIEIYL